ncbi:hypothetical protein GCM10010216_67070 [Streptomyces flaveolus]|nr:hypothetical protein GCM10010216_67070 [Streptomyces flaveolus]
MSGSMRATSATPFGARRGLPDESGIDHRRARPAPSVINSGSARTFLHAEFVRGQGAGMTALLIRMADERLLTLRTNVTPDASAPGALLVRPAGCGTAACRAKPSTSGEGRVRRPGNGSVT